MTTLQKGQLSYLILSCLVEKDMYGLELIEEIKKRSGVEVKLPSLYSNLNRMKDLKFISSYLKESTKGPKCAYSSITENGRKEFEKLKESFGSQSFISENVESEKVETKPLNEEIKEEQEEISEEIEEIKKDEDYDDFFAEIPDEDEVKSEETAVESAEEVNEETEEIENNEEDLETESSPILEEHVEEKTDEPQEKTEEITETEEPKNDAVFLSNDDRTVENEAHEYNKKIFDVSMDYNKNKNRKSFAENQIEMVVKDAVPVEEQREKTITNVNSLKEALLQSRQGNYDHIVLPTSSPSSQPAEEKVEQAEVKEEKEELVEEKVFDDGIFITDRVDYIPKAKRFEPPKINLLVPNEVEPLPAPKRNANLDPNCSDIRAKIESLYALSKKNSTPVKDPTKEEVSTSKIENSIDNFEDLKDYYDSQNISFKVYKRAEKKITHNTNKIVFFVDLITLGLIAFGSALFYLIFSLTGLTNPNTNFLYYLLPILYFVYVGIRFYMYKRISSKVPRPLFNFIVVWGSAILLSGVVFCLNLASGVPVNALTPCISSIVLPIFVIFAIFIVRHYIMLFSLKRYWR